MQPVAYPAQFPRLLNQVRELIVTNTVASRQKKPVCIGFAFLFAGMAALA